MLRKNWLVLFSLLVLGCNREDVADLGHDFFPLGPDVHRIYEVNEDTYVDGGLTTQNYQLRESVSDSIQTNDNWTYILLIERRETAEDNWRSIETISVRRTNRILDYRKNNKSIIKLSFPVRKGRVWDGNALNSDVQMQYFFDELNDEEPFGPEEHIKVIISDLPANIVEQDERTEIYARGIGLVERQFTQIEFCQQGCGSVNEPENGTILYQRLIEYGQS